MHRAPWLVAAALSILSIGNPLLAQTGLESRTQRNPFQPPSTAPDPYGRSPSHQKIDRDQINAFVRDVAGLGKEPIEESELEDLIDDFEDKYKVYVGDRDVLVTSSLDAKGLVNALEASVVKSNTSSDESTIKRKRWVPIGPKVRNGKFDERQRLPGLEIKNPGDPSQPGSSIDYFANGSQKNNGVTRDYRSRWSGSYDNRQSFHESYQERRKRLEGNPYFPPEPTMRELDERATEFYSNGRPKFDKDGNELHANGAKKFSKEGVPLYSNGRPRTDSQGNELHSNGRQKLSIDGRPLFANGQPRISDKGVPLGRDGARRQSDDGRALYANGTPVESVDGVKLHANGKKMFTGDGLGESPFAPEGAGTEQKVDLVQELYSNGKPTFSADGDRLYSSGRRRATETGDFLYPDGKRLETGDSIALSNEGSTIRGERGFKGRAQGQFRVFDLVEAVVVKRDDQKLIVKPKGSTDEVEVDASRAFVGRTVGSEVLVGDLNEIIARLSITVVSSSLADYVDGKQVSSAATQVQAILATNPRVGAGAKVGERTAVQVVSGRLATWADGQLVVETGAAREQQHFDVADAVFQKGKGAKAQPIPREALRLGASVEVVAQVTWTPNDEGALSPRYQALAVLVD